MGDLVVLCYHAVSDGWPDSLAVTRDALRRQLGWLVGRGYRGATFSEACASRSPHPRVVVTFDDAFTSVGDLAFPILDELGLPGTVFAVSDFASSGRPLQWDGIAQWRGGEHDHELAGMDFSRLAELRDAGWEIGSHTVAHPRLSHLADRELHRELVDSRAACEQALGAPCRSIAYPYGDMDARVAAAADAAGYEFAAALRSPPDPSTRMNWKRVGIYRRDDLDRFKLKVSPAMRSLQSMGGRALAASGAVSSRWRR